MYVYLKLIPIWFNFCLIKVLRSKRVVKDYHTLLATALSKLYTIPYKNISC